MFIDTAKIHVKAGNGGNGVVSFHREKYVAAGGPDGGDGGNGGSIVLTVDDHMSTLMDFRYRRKYAAGNGEPGAGKRCSGKAGSNLIIRVPRATVIRIPESGAILHDMSDGKDYVLAKGGSGGWGNHHFATPTRQVPRFAKSGLPGEEREVLLELKLLADVGLVGFPNVGKSTLLSVISAARPKIANYHFTTLQPNLGVVSVGDESFVCADIPGIIEGASEGLGLGHDFLRHIDRCRLILHIVDISGFEGRDPVEDYVVINEELSKYSPELGSRPQLVVGNKADILEADAPQKQRFEAFLRERGLEWFEISAATGQGVDQLLYRTVELLRSAPPIQYYEPEYQAPEPSAEGPDTVSITVQDGIYNLEGEWLMRIARDINFNEYEQRVHFERLLRQAGIFDRLEEMGISEGDTVSIYNIDFDYVK